MSSPNLSPTAPSHARILIADDESLIRLDLREMLSELGYDVIGEAGDGRAALDLARKLLPDLVVMDIKMPGLDGIAAAEQLTRERICPVVLLTAYSDQELVERAREAGVVGYVVKPFRPTELMPVIELSLARFEENAGKTNTSLVRLEGHAAFGVERQTAAVRIAAS